MAFFDPQILLERMQKLRELNDKLKDLQDRAKSFYEDAARQNREALARHGSLKAYIDYIGGLVEHAESALSQLVTRQSGKGTSLDVLKDYFFSAAEAHIDALSVIKSAEMLAKRQHDALQGTNIRRQSRTEKVLGKLIRLAALKSSISSSLQKLCQLGAGIGIQEVEKLLEEPKPEPQDPFAKETAIWVDLMLPTETPEALRRGVSLGKRRLSLPTGSSQPGRSLRLLGSVVEVDAKVTDSVVASEVTPLLAASDDDCQDSVGMRSFDAEEKLSDDAQQKSGCFTACRR